MTAKELAQLPDDGYRYELLQGELIKMAPPDRLHAKRQGRLVYEFVAYADRYGGEAGGEAGFHLEIDPDTVLAPDATYTRPERVPKSEERGFGRYAPDVAAEIDSPSNRPGERRRKVKAYHQAGTRIVLFVNDEKRTVTVEHADGRTEVLHEGDVFDGGDVMPGFRLPVSEFFR
ncbi:MAG TPA: Uma2 family endonuclease [Thermomicrobiales bacterium]|nr:Uma2 family endonuclease [Thermomicrobiales bacterium]